MQDYYRQEMSRDRIRDLECELEYRRQSADGWIVEPLPLAGLASWVARVFRRSPSRSVAVTPDQSEASSHVA